MSDPSPMLAAPLVTLPRDERDQTDIGTLVGLIAEHEVVEVVVGLPKTLAGKTGVAAEHAIGYADLLGQRLTVPVRLADERLTTVSAGRMLSDRGVRGRKQRGVIDQAAAAEILQTWLDARSNASRPTGEEA